MRDVEVFADEIFGFHVQQAADKLFKAWIALLGGEYSFTHNLDRLLESLEEQGVVMTQFWPLTGYSPYASGICCKDDDLSVAPIDRERNSAHSGIAWAGLSATTGRGGPSKGHLKEGLQLFQKQFHVCETYLDYFMRNPILVKIYMKVTCGIK